MRFTSFNKYIHYSMAFSNSRQSCSSRSGCCCCCVCCRWMILLSESIWVEVLIILNGIHMWEADIMPNALCRWKATMTGGKHKRLIEYNIENTNTHTDCRKKRIHLTDRAEDVATTTTVYVLCMSSRIDYKTQFDELSSLGFIFLMSLLEMTIKRATTKSHLLDTPTV